MEKAKEFTHNYKTTWKSNPCCLYSFYCTRCRGLCIFHPDFLLIYLSSPAIKHMISEKYYPKEFELIRELDVKNPELKLHEEELDPYKENNVDILTEFELLEKFQKLTDSDRHIVLKAHNSRAPLRYGFKPHFKQTKSHKVLHLNKNCSHWKEPISVDRRKKNSNLVQDNSLLEPIEPKKIKEVDLIKYFESLEV